MLIGLEFYLAYFMMILCTVGGGGLVALSCWTSRNQMSGAEIPEGLYALSAAIASSIVSGVALVGGYLVGRGVPSVLSGIWNLSVIGVGNCGMYVDRRIPQQFQIHSESQTHKV
jgi:hypothetical protein